ncbi:hypothetical protein C8J56DRAFT_1055253 [Mycena floridula]|nr:hypothetical protein C8J56DRAFT_1055253 [Mycena floridula]
MYCQTGFRVFRLLILLLLAASQVLGTITLNVLGDITAGSTHDIQWNRDHNDPDTFILVKFDLDGQKGPTPNFNETATVTANDSLNGTVQMIFHNSHHFQVTAFAEDEATSKKPPLAFSNTFKVDKSDNDNQDGANNKNQDGANSNSETTDPTSATVTFLTSTSVVFSDTTSEPETPTAASAVTSPQDDAKRESNHTAIIVASVLGGLVGLIILGIVLYFYWRYSMDRREKKLSRTMLMPTRHNIDFNSMYPDVEDGNNKSRPLDTPYSGAFGANHEKFRFPSVVAGSEVSVPTLRFAPLTDRQMDIQERIHDQESRMVFMRDEREIETSKVEIEALKRLQASDWALGLTDEVPPGL